MKVIGIGLPRTGTKTLAQALRSLGYCGTNVCVLTGHMQIDDQNKGIKRFTVNNAAYLGIEALTKRFGFNALFILTTRDTGNWLESASMFPRYLQMDMPMPAKYREVVEKLIPKERLLIIDIFRESSTQLWEKLCRFLKEPIPRRHFPEPLCTCPSCSKSICTRKRSKTI